jgi:nitrate/nitrite-specific signal transduction histidine kinase
MRAHIRWGGLRTKIAAWFLIPTAVIVVVVALFVFNTYQRVTEDLVLERNRELVQLLANQLAGELLEYGSQLSDLAATSEISQFEPLIQQDFLRRSVGRLTAFDGGVVVLDRSGTVVAADPRRAETLGQDWSDRGYVERMWVSPRVVVSNHILSDGPQGTDVVAVAVPIQSDEGMLVGMFTLDGDISINGLRRSISNLVSTLVQGEEQIYLVDGDGDVVYHSDATFTGESFAEEEIVQRVLAGETDSLRTRDAGGVEIVASFAPVGSPAQSSSAAQSFASPATRNHLKPTSTPRTGTVHTTWGLVMEESWDELTRTSRRYGQLLLLFLSLGAIIPAGVIALGARQITRPIADLTEAAQDIAGGNLGRVITVRTRDELEELASQFNLMSTQLQESYAFLEQRVIDRTKELATLNELGQALATQLDIDQVLEEIYRGASRLLDTSEFFIALYDSSSNELSFPLYATEGIVRKSQVSRSAKRGITGYIIRNRTPVLIKEDLEGWLEERDIELIGPASLSWLGVPLMIGDQVLGVIAVESYLSSHAYDEHDQDLFTSIASQAAIAIQNAQLFAEVQRRLREQQALYRADEELYRHLDLNQVLDSIVDVAVDILQADKSSLMVWDEQRARLEVRAAHNFGPETLAEMTFGPGEGTVGIVGMTGEPAIVEDTHLDTRVSRRVTDAEGIRSFLHVPIEIGDQIYGVFNVDYTEPRQFGDDDLRLFTALAQRAAIAIENAQLYEQAQELAMVEERQRLARDLHDAVSQTLFSASMIADVLPLLWERNPKEGRRRLEELRRLTRGAQAEMRTLLFELRPATLAETSLSDLLRQLCEAITGRARLQVALEVEGDCTLPPDINMTLYRIAQEALNNVVKHAEAEQVTVTLHRTPEQVELRVYDDGRGFDPSDIPPDHLGVGIMRERAKASGADLTIESSPGQGTEITVRWTDPAAK